MAEGVGPSYYDVERYVEYLRDRYGVGVNFLLVPPLYIRASGRKTSWVVSAKAWYLSDSREMTIGGQAAFGRGGSWATLPAAQHAALRALEAKLESRRLEAERRAAL